MKTRLSPSSAFLALHGVILTGLGLYFVFLRPPLLPEDPRYMGTTVAEIQATMPGLLIWLRRVFWVMGGFMVTAGLLTAYIAITVFQQLARGARFVVALASLTSIGWMAAPCLQPSLDRGADPFLARGQIGMEHKEALYKYHQTAEIGNFAYSTYAGWRSSPRQFGAILRV